MTNAVALLGPPSPTLSGNQQALWMNATRSFSVRTGAASAKPCDRSLPTNSCPAPAEIVAIIVVLSYKPVVSEAGRHNAGVLVLMGFEWSACLHDDRVRGVGAALAVAALPQLSLRTLGLKNFDGEHLASACFDRATCKGAKRGYVANASKRRLPGLSKPRLPSDRTRLLHYTEPDIFQFFHQSGLA